MKKIIAPFILVIFSMPVFNLYAQSNWLPAYITVSENDILYGLVNFRLTKLNQEECLFKENENSPVVAYSPEDISGYRFTPTGKYFISKTIEIDNVSKKVFVEFLVEGMMDLYYYVDYDVKNNISQAYYFFEDENKKLFSLTKNKSTVKDYRIKEDSKYDGIIRYQFQEYYPIAHNPKKYEFNQKSMIELVKTYHTEVCTTGEECIVYENVLPDKRGIQYKATIYAGMEHLLFKYDYDKQTIGRSMMIIGCEFDLSYPQWVKNLSFVADISIGRLVRDLDIKTHRYEKDYYSYYQKIDFKAYPLSIRPGFKYVYPIGRFSPMVKVAYSYKHFLGDFAVLKYPIIGDDYYRVPDISSNYDRNYSGIHVALGSEYYFKNKGAVLLDLFFDTYIKKEFKSEKPTFSDSFLSYGFKASYLF